MRALRLKPATYLIARGLLAASQVPNPQYTMDPRIRNSTFATCSTSNSSSSVDLRQAHNALQAEHFTGDVRALQASITPDVDARLARVAQAVPDLGPDSRVLDVGAGTGALIPHLQRRGVYDVLAVEVCPAMLDALRENLHVEDAPVLGNEPCVRIWQGDVAELPAYQGPFDAAFFNAVFGNLYDPREALLKVALMMRPGGYVIISHPLGRGWHERYAAKNPDIVPHALPDESALHDLIHDLPLSLDRVDDESNFYLALLRVPEGYAHPRAPIHLFGNVIPGFGRGSKQLGVPTANIPPEPLTETLRGLSTGVYFGWARIEPVPGAPAADAEVHKMVMNIGKRPTFEDKDPELSVELHVMHDFADDFYDRPVRAVVLGFIRPEVKFGGLAELLARIQADIGIARSQLDSMQWKGYKEDPFLML
jgi:riboflavin kinase